MHLITTAAHLLGDNMRQQNTKMMQISLDFLYSDDQDTAFPSSN